MHEILVAIILIGWIIGFLIPIIVPIAILYAVYSWWKSARKQGVKKTLNEQGLYVSWNDPREKQ